MTSQTRGLSCPATVGRCGSNRRCSPDAGHGGGARVVAGANADLFPASLARDPTAPVELTVALEDAAVLTRREATPTTQVLAPGCRRRSVAKTTGNVAESAGRARRTGSRVVIAVVRR